MKRLLASVAGILSGTIIITMLEYVGRFLYPAPATTDFNNPEAVKQFIANMPAWAFVYLLVVYAIGAFGGGAIATLVGKRTMVLPVWITGIVLTVGAIANLIMIPQPMWFAVINVIEYIPCAYLGWVLLRRHG